MTAWCGACHAAVRVPAIIGEHMMLQAGGRTPIYGWADPGEAVAVSVGDAKATTTAGPDGKWQVIFTGLKPSATPVTVTIAGTNTLTYLKWKSDSAKAGNPGEVVPRPVGMDLWEDNVMALPTVLFNSMIAPIIPFGIKGAIWYQGEGNADEWELYRTLFPAMVRDWRTRWGQGDFPIYTVQLSSYRPPRAEPAESNWAAFREIQTQLQTIVPNSGMAVTVDIGNAMDIHPLSKAEVGRRLALVALAKTYHHPIECSGPLYQRMETKDGKVVLYFTQVGGGLTAKDGEPLKRFAISGADRKFVWGDAKIDGQTVVVSCPQVPSPVAVRYAWDINPDGCNLFNASGLPASPFRTDDWKLEFSPP